MELNSKLNRLIEKIQSGRYTSLEIEKQKEEFLDYIESIIEDSYSNGYETAEGDFNEGRS
jgi:methyl coenzyme M reductase subunit D